MERPEDRKRRLARARKQAQRDRERAARKAAPDLSLSYVRSSFADYLDGGHLAAEEALHFAGVIVTGSLAEEDHAECYPGDEEWEDIQGVPLNSLNRATVMVGAFLDAAHELAGLVNAFKRQEIEQRITEAEAASADKAMIEELHAIRTTLRREEQHRFPRYHVRGY